MNELALEKLREHEEKHSLTAALSKVHVTSKDAPLTYTPVTEETFALWCKGYMAKIKRWKEEKKTERDMKPSGKQIFEQR